MQEANTGIPDSRREGAEQAHKTESPLWKKLLIIFSGRKGEPAETPPTQTREEATWVYTFDAIFPNTEWKHFPNQRLERQALQVIVEADLAWLEDLREGSNMRFILCINRLAASKKTEAWTEQQYRAIATVLLDDEARIKRLEEKGLFVQLDSQDKYYLSTVELAQLPDHERTKIARALREFDDLVERHNNSGGIQTNEQGEICIGGDYRLKSSFEDELADILGPVDPKYQQAFTLKLALERLSKRPKAEGRRTRDYLASEGADALRESFGNF